MTEWLTENRNRAYPLANVLPDSVDRRWSGLLLDASVACDWTPDEVGTLKLVNVWNSRNGSIAIRIGADEDPDRSVKVSARAVQQGRTVVVFYAGKHVKAYLTLDGEMLRSLCEETADVSAFGVNVPLALRCCSYANRRVTSIDAYAPAAGHKCDHIVWPDERSEVTSAAGDVVLVSKDGIDIDVTQMSPLVGDLLRFTAVTAPLQILASDKPVDMMIRGDECVQVEAIPFVDENGSPTENCGVIRLTEKCKPCCQCEDYENAVKALTPGDEAVHAIETEVNRAKASYESAVGILDQIKETAASKLNGYGHVLASAVAVASGGVTPDVTLTGKRWRLAVNLTVVNMALQPVEIRGLTFAVPDYDQDKVQWSTAGSRVRSGTSISATWSVELQPGDTLAVVATYAKSANDNSAYKPYGMLAKFTACLPSPAADKLYEVEVR